MSWFRNDTPQFSVSHWNSNLHTTYSPTPFSPSSLSEDLRGELEPQKAKLMGLGKNYLLETAMR